MCEREQFYVPSYVNRFTKLGSVFRMWFKPLQEIVGDIVNYEEENDEEVIVVGSFNKSASQENMDRSNQPTGLPGVDGNQSIRVSNGELIKSREEKRESAVPQLDDLEQGVNSNQGGVESGGQRRTQPDINSGEDAHHVLSMQADVISVLSGHSYARSGMKIKRDKQLNFLNKNAPMSMSNYDNGGGGGGVNHFSHAKNLLGDGEAHMAEVVLVVEHGVILDSLAEPGNILWVGKSVLFA